jgi:PDDEXK-like domain of unknown function (DUF3799)
MIAGTKKTVASYRGVDKDSYSTLKLFVENPNEYYKQMVTGEKKEKKSNSLILGDLVDVMILDERSYNDRFYEADCGEITATSPQIGQFALQLWKFTEVCLDEEGMCTREFDEIALDAFNAVKYDYNGEEIAFKKKELAYALKEFQGSKYEQWYEMQRNAIGKLIIDKQMKENADRIVQTIKNSPAGSVLYSGGWIDVEYQRQIEFDLYTLPCKSMFDVFHVDEKNKTLQVIDLKVTWESLWFDYNFYKMKYYIQAGVYMKALEYLRDREYPGWKLLPIKFLVADAQNVYDPLLYTLTSSDIDKCLNGFEWNGKSVKGVKNIVEDLIFCKESGNFRVLKGDYINSGVRQLKTFI